MPSLAAALLLAASATSGRARTAPSKAAAIMLVRVLAQELGPRGVRVNAVSPGVRTQMTERVHAGLSRIPRG